MIIVPKEKPKLENLNSYYLRTPKLVEHCQGEFGSGCIHFFSSRPEGIVFFDKDVLLGGVFQDKEGDTEGRAAIERIIESSQTQNFIVSIYKIDPRVVYFWTMLSGAKQVYRNLGTEFTNLRGLIKKMHSERFTGYIDI